MYFRLHLEKPWRESGGAALSFSASKTSLPALESQALRSNMTLADVYHRPASGGADGEVGSEAVLVWDTSGGSTVEGVRGVGEEPEWSVQAREVSGVSMRALESTGACIYPSEHLLSWN